MATKAKCTAKSKQTGKRCGQYPVPGCKVCRFHGGKAPQVEKAAEVRAAKMQAHAAAERMVARAGVDIDPIEHLLESLHRAAALVEVWGSMVAEIDATAAKEMDDGSMRGELGYDTVENEKYGGKDVVVLPKDRLLVVNTRGESQVHPFVKEYETWVVNRAKFAKLCIDAGVAERQVELGEQQVEIAHNAFEAGLDAAGLTKKQKQEARRAYANRLRSGV
jgi:hypothetical protein